MVRMSTGTAQPFANYKSAVYALLRKHFKLTVAQEQQATALFEEFVGIENRLESLLELPIAPMFKVRALAQWLAPSSSYLPFGKREMGLASDWFLASHALEPEFFGRRSQRFAVLVPPELRTVLVDLLELNVATVVHAGSSTMRESKRQKLLSHYNAWAVSLFEVVDEDGSLAKRLFSRCLKFDTGQMIDTKTELVFDAFGWPLASRAPLRWKACADAQLRREVAGKAETPYDPVVFYTRRVRECLRLQRFPYDRDLLVDQIRFALSCDSNLEESNWLCYPDYSSECWSPHVVAHRLLDTLLGARKYKDVRLAVIRDALDSRAFHSIDSSEHEQLVRYLLRKVGTADVELAGRLQELLDTHAKERDANELSARSLAAAHASKKAELLALMSEHDGVPAAVEE